MEQTNGNKYVPWKVFCWVIGIMIVILMATYGYIVTQAGQSTQQIQANTIMITRLEERLDGILATVIEIKDILKK